MANFDRERLRELKTKLIMELRKLSSDNQTFFQHITMFVDLEETYIHIVYAGNSLCKININGSGYDVTFTSEFSSEGHESRCWLPGYRSILSFIKTAILRYEYKKGQNDMSGTLYCEKDGKGCGFANAIGYNNYAFDNHIYMMSGRHNGKTQYILDKLKKPCITIKDVIFNDPATIVFWTDGSKTVVKCQKGETFDPEKGLAMAISKKMFGNNYGYYEIFAKYIGRYNKKRFNKALEEAKKIPPDEIVHNGVVYRRVEDGTKL